MSLITRRPRAAAAEGAPPGCLISHAAPLNLTGSGCDRHAPRALDGDG